MRRIALAASLVAMALPAAADDTTTSTGLGGPERRARYETQETEASRQVSEADRKFANEAAQSGLLEVELGRLAEQRGASSETKNFGKKMVEDHSAANTKLQRIAADNGISLPGGLDAESERTRSELQSKSGSDFDLAYTKHMIEGHEKAVSLFEKEAAGGTHTALKRFASETLPTISHHLEMARELRTQPARR